MFCGKCGTELDDNVKCCWKCGTSAENFKDPKEAQKQSAVISQIEKESVKKPKKGLKGIIIAVAVLIIAVAAIYVGTKILPGEVKDKSDTVSNQQDKDSMLADEDTSLLNDVERQMTDVEDAYYHMFTEVIPAGGTVPIVEIEGDYWDDYWDLGTGTNYGTEYINPAYYGYDKYKPCEETYCYLLKYSDSPFDGPNAYANHSEYANKDRAYSYTYKPGTEYEDPFSNTWNAYLRALNDVCKMNGMQGYSGTRTQLYDMHQIMNVSNRFECQSAQDSVYQDFMNMEYLLWYMTYMNYECNVTSEQDQYGTLVHVNIHNIDMMRLLYEELLKTRELVNHANITEASLKAAKAELGDFIQREKENMSTMYTTKRSYVLSGLGIYQTFTDTDVKFGDFDVTKRNVAILGAELTGNYIGSLLMQEMYDELCNNGTIMSLTLANMLARIEAGDYETVDSELSFYAFQDSEGNFRIPCDLRTARFVPEDFDIAELNGLGLTSEEYDQALYKAGVRNDRLSSFYLGDADNWAESLQAKGILNSNYTPPSKLSGYDTVYSVGYESMHSYKDMILWVIMGYRGDKDFQIREIKSDRLGIKETPEQRNQRIAEETIKEPAKESEETDAKEEVSVGMPNISELQVGDLLRFGSYGTASSNGSDSEDVSDYPEFFLSKLKEYDISVEVWDLCLIEIMGEDPEQIKYLLQELEISEEVTDEYRAEICAGLIEEVRNSGYVEKFQSELNYGSNENVSNKPILWMVLAIDGDYALLTTKDIIGYESFSDYSNASQTVLDTLGPEAVSIHEQNVSNPFYVGHDDWYTATLRGWLNSEFLERTFTEEEQSRIQSVNGDLVTIFDKATLEYYFPYEVDRVASNTEQAANEYSSKGAEFYGYWLQDRYYVDMDGAYHNTPLGGTSARGGIRPIIYVDLGHN